MSDRLNLKEHAWVTIVGWDGEPEDGYVLRSYVEALEAEVERKGEVFDDLLKRLDTLHAEVQGEQEATFAARRDLAAARAALETIAGEADTGRGDSLPEPCPALDAETMWGVARAALAALPTTPEQEGKE